MGELLDMSMARMQRTIKIMKYQYKSQQFFTCYETWISCSHSGQVIVDLS